MSKVSLAFENLRAFVIVMVLAFHSFMAYMTFQPLSQSSFDKPPYDWQAHPIIDENRWRATSSASRRGRQSKPDVRPGRYSCAVDSKLTLSNGPRPAV